MRNSAVVSTIVASAMFGAIAACAGDTGMGGSDSAIASTTSASVTPTSTAVTSSPNATAIPKSINDVGTYGEDLYDEVKTGNWKRVRPLLDSLHVAVKALPANDQAKQQRAILDRAISALDRAVVTHNRTAALEASNRVTFVSAQMTTPYRGPTPAEVLLLDYYGREMDIWAAQKNLARLKQTAAGLTTTWKALRPTVEKQGGGTTAARTDALVARINAAKTPSDYSKISMPLLDEVDALEKVFTTQ